MKRVAAGDRVRVEVEGTIADGAFGTYRVQLDDGHMILARGEQCTVLPPLPKVGDPVTADNIDALPHGAIVIARAGLAAQVHDHTAAGGKRYWQVVGAHDVFLPSTILHWPATIVHIPGTAS